MKFRRNFLITYGGVAVVGVAALPLNVLFYNSVDQNYDDIDGAYICCKVSD